MENHEPTAMIYAPRTAGQYDRLKATDNQPLVRPASMQEIPHLITYQVASNLAHSASANTSPAFVGDFTKLWFGFRTGLSIEIDRKGEAFSRYQVQLRAVLRSDIGILHPKAFSVVKGIKE